MNVAFLTPLGAALAALTVAPLAVYVLRRRRARRIRRTLGLAPSPAGSGVALVLALAAVPCVLGLAAAQPVLESERSRLERTDAEAWIVVDTSRSMLASATVDSPTRLDRARSFAEELANDLPDVRVGIASMTDRVLPHAFPTTDRRVVAATLRQSIGIERPGPTISLSDAPTTIYDALAALPKYDYYSPSARKRLLVVLTDGEARPPEIDLSRPFGRGPRIATVLVQFWAEDEHVYSGGVPEDRYHPLAGSAAALQEVASRVDGTVFTERDPARVLAAVRASLGTGPTHDRIIEGERRALMPWVTLFAFLPLGFVLVRRNV